MIFESPTLRIDLSSRTPAYEQIVAALRALLVRGGLKPGDRLPTVRELAIDLGVHHNTVAEAYRRLAAEGWLDLRRRRGAVVLDRLAPRPTQEAQARFARALGELVADALAAGVPQEAVAGELDATAATLSEEESS